MHRIQVLPWTTASRASCPSWPCAGRPKPPPNRACSYSTSPWPPNSASNPAGCAARTGCVFSSATWSPTGRCRWPRPTPDTSSVVMFRASATAGHCCWAKSRRPTGGLRDLHLKGSGATPFARGGDGFAAVGPMLREYIISEAMHALGIPTTRSLAVVATGRASPARDAAAGGRAHPRREQPPARRHLPVRRGRRRRRTAAAAGRSRHRPALPGTGRRRQSLPRVVRRRGVRAGGAHRAVDARRVRAWRDEHGQHDDLGRDDRLRAVRLHGGLRPGDGLQLDRLVGPLRLRQPAVDRGVESRPLRRDAAAADRRRPGPRGGSRPGEPRRIRPRRSSPHWRRVCAPSSGWPTASTSRWRRR